MAKGSTWRRAPASMLMAEVVCLALAVSCCLAEDVVRKASRPGGDLVSAAPDEAPAVSQKGLLEELLEMDPPMLGPHRREDMREPSEFMLHEVYENIADVDTGELRTRDGAADNRKDLVGRTSTPSPMLREDIYSFASNGISKHSELIPRGRHLEELSGWKLSFNLQQFRSKNHNRKVQYATLAIYGKHCYPDVTKPRKIAARRMSVGTFAQLLLGQNRTKEWVPVVERQHIRMRECWQTFNVTLAVNKWQQHHRPGHSEILLVTSPREQRGNLSDVYDLDDLLELHDQKTGKHVVLVVYSGNPVELETKERSSRGKRSISSEAKPTRRKIKEVMPVRGSNYELCARRNLRVDVKHLGVAIVAPKNGIKIFRCAGSCRAPILVQKTLHAEMESIFSAFDPDYYSNPDLAGGPCCVPTQFHRISVLMSTGNGVNIMKIFKKFVAERCGCR